MNYLLDTNVISELRPARARIPDANVAAWASRASAQSLFLSSITIMELEHGTLLMERRDRSQGAALRKWLNGAVLAAFEDRVLAVDLEIAQKAAAFQVPNPRPFRDALIAATAHVHQMTVVTRDVADFAPTGVELLNPWQP